MRSDIAETRDQILSALLERRDELERAVATRVYAIAEPRERSDPEYLAGLRSSLTVAIDYALTVVERGESAAPAPPPSLLTQARMAARNQVGLDTVLRRYVAGHALLIEYMLEAAAEHDVDLASLGVLHAGQVSIVDRLLEAVSAEYDREAAGLVRSPRERVADRVRRLLSGEPIEANELGYELGAFHVGIVGHGPRVATALDSVATALDMRLLQIPAEDDRTWAWLGRSSAVGPTEVDRIARSIEDSTAPGDTVAIGEPGKGILGWRFSHRQAAAIFPVAQRSPATVVRYSTVGLLASVEQDEILARSLRELYLDRLSDEPDGGRRLRETLRAYLAHGRNTTSAAAALGVNRETVRNRVRAAEDKIGRSVDDCAAELEIALRLAEGPSVRAPRLHAVPALSNRPIM